MASSIIIPIGSIIFSVTVAVLAFIKTKLLQKEAFYNSIFSYIVKERNILYRDFSNWLSEKAIQIFENSSNINRKNFIYCLDFELLGFELRFRSLNLTENAEIIKNMISSIYENIKDTTNNQMCADNFASTVLGEYIVELRKVISMENLLKEDNLKILQKPIDKD